MPTNEVNINLEGRSQGYSIKILSDILSETGEWTRECLGNNTKKVAIFSNEKVFGLYGNKVLQSLEKKGFEVCLWLMKDGERHKSFQSLQESLTFLSENNIKRNNAVIALGGGVVGDLTGFAASIYLRGVKFLQIPTTLLSMIDSSVGGKTAVNTEFGKNLVGTFYQPSGVLIDVKTLQTLEHRELIAGFCEAIKQGAIGSHQLLNKIHKFLTEYKLENFAKLIDKKEFADKFKEILSTQVSFKAEIVMQDEQETVARNDTKSRKILNFGHTTAHALEKITNYKYFKHGEAVGLGILVAAEISKRLAILDTKSINLLNDVVSLVGELPQTNDIEINELFELFVFDKKSTGKSVQWILLEGIGKPKIIDSSEIANSIIKDSLRKVLHK